MVTLRQTWTGVSSPLIGSAYDSCSQGQYAKEGIRGLLCKSGTQEQYQDIKGGNKVSGHPTNDYLG